MIFENSNLLQQDMHSKFFLFKIILWIISIQSHLTSLRCFRFRHEEKQTNCFVLWAMLNGPIRKCSLTFVWKLFNKKIMVDFDKSIIESWKSFKVMNIVYKQLVDVTPTTYFRLSNLHLCCVCTSKCIVGTT